LSTTNPTWPDLGSNPGRRGGKPATNRLSYGTAKSISLLPRWSLLVRCPAVWISEGSVASVLRVAEWAECGQIRRYAYWGRGIGALVLDRRQKNSIKQCRFSRAEWLGRNHKVKIRIMKPKERRRGSRNCEEYSSSGIWHHVVRWNVSEEHIASIFRIEEIGSANQQASTTRLHIPEDDILHNHRRENLKSYIAGIVLRLAAIVSKTATRHQYWAIYE
jgi:hypothetical protein